MGQKEAEKERKNGYWEYLSKRKAKAICLEEIFNFQ